MDDINGFEFIKDEERIMIIELMDEVNEKRAAAEISKPKKTQRALFPWVKTSKHV